VCNLCLGQNGHWSNERTVAHYVKLAEKIMTQFIRTYRIPRQEIPDFRAQLTMEMVKMPASYRANSAGAYTIIKNAAIIWVRKYQKWANKETDGIPDDGDGDMQEEGGMESGGYARSMDYFTDEVDWMEKLQNRRLAEQMLIAMQKLPQPERICLSFHYGINTVRPLSQFLIARKLGVSMDWVKRRICRGEFLLHRALEANSLKVRGNTCQIQSSPRRPLPPQLRQRPQQRP
jgi:DNA-directed RNA polymerase specialized sigma24 family protein